MAGKMLKVWQAITIFMQYYRACWMLCALPVAMFWSHRGLFQTLACNGLNILPQYIDVQNSNFIYDLLAGWYSITVVW